MEDEFIWWLGEFGMYMRAEHGIDLIKEITPLVEKGTFGPETFEYLYHQYKTGKAPKDVADFLVNNALNPSYPNWAAD